MKKIGELKNIPVVIGKENEIKENQIYLKEEEGFISLYKRNKNDLELITKGEEEGSQQEEKSVFDTGLFIMNYRFTSNGNTNQIMVDMETGYTQYFDGITTPVNKPDDNYYIDIMTLPPASYQNIENAEFRKNIQTGRTDFNYIATTIIYNSNLYTYQKANGTVINSGDTSLFTNVGGTNYHFDVIRVRKK